MKKLTALILSLLLCLGSCAALADEKPVIGIIQYVEHVALDAAREGFVQALKDNGYEDGQNVTIYGFSDDWAITNHGFIQTQYLGVF